MKTRHLFARRAWVWGALLLMTVLHLTTFGDTEGRQQRLNGTRRANVVLSYNLHQHHTFSMALAQPRTVSAYRPPGYPVYLALGMAGIPELGRHDLGDLIRRSATLLGPLFHMQKLTLLLTAYLATLAVWLATRNRWLSLLPFPFICHVPLWPASYRSVLNDYTDLLYPTPLSTMLVTALGLVLWLAVEKRATWQFALAGLLAGGLALTRASFLYFIFLGLPALGLWVWRHPGRRWLAPRAACCCGIALIVVFGWMARNQQHFGRWFIAERGGYQLNVRAQMLDMNRTTYLASFLYWSNSRFLEKTALKRLIGNERRREVERLLNSGSPTSYKRRAKLTWYGYRDRHRSSVEADRTLLRDSADQIRARPFRHAMISIPLLHRGICWEKPYVLNLLLFAAFLAVTVTAAVRRQVALLALFSPALFCLAFNTALTNNLPRYNTPVLPLMWVALAIVVHRGLFSSSRFG